MLKDGPHKMGNFSRGPPAPLELALLHIANNWHRVTPSIKYYNATFNCKQSIISLIFKRGISKWLWRGGGQNLHFPILITLISIMIMIILIPIITMFIQYYPISWWSSSPSPPCPSTITHLLQSVSEMRWTRDLSVVARCDQPQNR